jgi:ribonucleotide reductase beta subunit family protein with ferritin-like domain
MAIVIFHTTKMEVYSVPSWGGVFEKLHDEQMNHFWRPPLKSKFMGDVEDWKSISPEVQKKIKTVLRVLTAMETEIIDGIGSVSKDLNIRVIEIMLSMQEAMEGIHTRSYKVIDDALEYEGDLYDDLIERRMELLKWNMTDMSISEKLIHMICSEGISLNNIFPIFYLLEMKGLLPMTCTINKEVLSDENLHTKSAAAIYNTLCKQSIIERLPEKKVYEIVSRYVEVDDVASKALYGDNDPFFLTMNEENSNIYTRIVANSILRSLGYQSLYPYNDNPYTFIDQSLINTLEFFFDKEVVAYGLDAENDYDDESDDENCYDSDEGDE